MATAEQLAQYKKNALDTANKIGAALDNVVANRPTPPINSAGQSSAASTSMGAPKLTPPPTGSPSIPTGAPNMNKPPVPPIPNLNSNQTNYVNKNYGSANNYVQSQIDRYQNAAASGDRDLYTRVQTDANRLGYQLPNVPLNQNGIKSTDPNTGLPTWIGAGVNQEVQAQIDALMGQQQAAQQAAQFGVNQNQQFLQQQLAALAAQQAVDTQGAQDLQNRRGGFYSGGLDYQLGSIGSAYANQRGQLGSEIASRNQQLLDQYGTQANTIAQQIAGLQSNRPQLVNEAINNYLTQQAQLTGNYLGNRTLEGQAQDYSQKADNRNYNRDVIESDRNFNFQQQQFSYQQARDKIADKQYQQKFDEDVRRFGLEFALNSAVQNRQLNQADARISLDRQQFGASQYNQGVNQLIDIWRTSGVAPQGIPGVKAGTPYTGQQQLPQNNAPDLSELGRYFDGIAQRDSDTGQVTNPDALENAILNSAVSDYDAYQLYNRYGLKWDGPVPSPN